MSIHDLLRLSIVRAPADGAGGGAAAEAADPPAPAAGTEGAPADPPAAPAPKWYEGETFQSFEAWLTAKGMKVDDPAEALSKAVRVAQGAEKLLGRGVERLIEKPAADANLAEWMRSNGEIFGLPEAPDKYEIEKPQLPEGVEWDAGFEAKVREIAHEHALPPAALQAMVAAYGEKVSSLIDNAGSQLQAAQAEMMRSLEADWGASAQARISQAQAAARAVAEKAGLDGEALAGVVQALSPKTGDAGVMKLFAAIGEMMGEDSLTGGGAGPGGFTPGNTPQEAKARLAALDSPDGEFGRAYAKGDRATMERLRPMREALLKLASGGR